MIFAEPGKAPNGGLMLTGHEFPSNPQTDGTMFYNAREMKMYLYDAGAYERWIAVPQVIELSATGHFTGQFTTETPIGDD